MLFSIKSVISQEQKKLFHLHLSPWDGAKLNHNERQSREKEKIQPDTKINSLKDVKVYQSPNKEKEANHICASSTYLPSCWDHLLYDFKVSSPSCTWFHGIREWRSQRTEVRERPTQAETLDEI